MSIFSSFLDQLRIDLQQELPGRPAQYSMAPRPRPLGEESDVPPANARKSGVLILFYPNEETVYFPLILRPSYGGVHSGQVSLPGGGKEEDDRNLVETALREANEEIGIAPESVTVLGKLSSLYISPSNYIVQPVVGWLDHRPDFTLDPREVELLIEAPLAEFVNPANKRTEVWKLRGRTADVPYFGIKDQTVWGATAMILGELLALPAIELAPCISNDGRGT